MNVAVVGAGIMGASAARFLSRRGHTVTVFEQFEPGHNMGSSHGHSRIVRKAYPDAFYTSIMQEAYPMWAELEAEVGETLLFECGLLYFGSSRSADIVSTQAGLAANDVPFQLFDRHQVRAVFPELRLEPDEVGIWTPDAGWVRAERAVQASLDLAIRHGAALKRDRVDSLDHLEAVYDAVVVAPGGWIGQFVDLDVEVQFRTFAYLEMRQSGPVWIDDGPGLHYGFPTEPGADTVKIGGHVCGGAFDPNRPDRPIDSANVAAIQEMATRRFGGPEPTVREAAMCLYTRTPNEDFRIDRISDKAVFASPCSGHGFKFGPWVGKYLADLTEGRRETSEYPRFRRVSG